MSNDVSYFKVLNDNTKYAFDDADAEVRIDDLDSTKAPIANPSMTWDIGATGSVTLRRGGDNGSRVLVLDVKPTEGASSEFGFIIKADGSRNWVTPDRTVNGKALSSDITLSASDVSAVPATMQTKVLSDQTTSSTGAIDLGLTTSAAAVLGCANASYIMIPFVYNNGWRVRAIDNSGNRVVSTNVGTVTVYYLEL